MQKCLLLNLVFHHLYKKWKSYQGTKMINSGPIRKPQKVVDRARTLPLSKYLWKKIWSICGMIFFRETMSTVNITVFISMIQRKDWSARQISGTGSFITPLFLSWNQSMNNNFYPTVMPIAPAKAHTKRWSIVREWWNNINTISLWMWNSFFHRLTMKY